ncbi:transposase [Frankia torreyi]|uniref:Transposase n=1 Tax=Frankia torreyi TaxID=1856 RepID=A0A0D8B598_9ACTN|nr:transposase [Frankia torreyi]
MVVRWYLRYSLSYRDVEELLAERGITVDHATIYRWVQRFTPLLVEAARPCRPSPGDRWFVDETYVKVAGRWTYLYRAIDQVGQVIDVLAAERRDLARNLHGPRFRPPPAIVRPPGSRYHADRRRPGEAASSIRRFPGRLPRQRPTRRPTTPPGGGDHRAGVLPRPARCRPRLRDGSGGLAAGPDPDHGQPHGRRGPARPARSAHRAASGTDLVPRRRLALCPGGRLAAGQPGRTVRRPHRRPRRRPRLAHARRARGPRPRPDRLSPRTSLGPVQQVADDRVRPVGPRGPGRSALAPRAQRDAVAGTRSSAVRHGQPSCRRHGPAWPGRARRPRAAFIPGTSRYSARNASLVR